MTDQTKGAPLLPSLSTVIFFSRFRKDKTNKQTNKQQVETEKNTNNYLHNDRLRLSRGKNTRLLGF